MLDNLIKFLPVSSIFYFIGAFLPLVVILFTLGNLVYTIGEFKEQEIPIPKILVKLSAKVGGISIIFYGILNLLLAKNEFIQNMEALLILLYGCIIVVESIIINRLLFKINSFLAKETFRIDNANKLIHKIIANITCNSKIVAFIATLFVFFIFIATIPVFIYSEDPIWWSILTVLFVFYCYLKLSFIAAVYKLKK